MNPPPPAWSVLLLAAGRGERFRAAGGGDKRLAPLADGIPLALAAADNALAGAGQLGAALHVVLDDVLSPLAGRLANLGARVVHSRRAGRGLGASLADGVAATAPGSGVIVALADMPAIPADIYPALVARLSPRGATIARPRLGKRPGHPVAFLPSWRDALLACDGERGAQDILSAHPDALAWVDSDDPGIVWDVDLPADLALPFAPTENLP